MKARDLKAFGPKVRPTTAKVLESMMAILAPDSLGVRAVDLFAGTGEVGLRLLAQGAETVLFVEGDARVGRALRGRLRESGHAGSALLVNGRLPGVLARLEGPFQMFLADPPYDWPEPLSLLPGLASLAAPGAILVVEHHHKTTYAETAGWRQYRQEKYGESRLTFFEFVSPETTCGGT